MRDMKIKKVGMPADKFQTSKHQSPLLLLSANNARYITLQLTKTYVWFCRHSDNGFSIPVTNIISSE